MRKQKIERRADFRRTSGALVAVSDFDRLQATVDRRSIGWVMVRQLSHFTSTPEHLWSAVEAGRQYDPTLEISRRAFSKMLRRYVPPMPYARETLFERMLCGQPSVLAGLPAPLRSPLRDLPPAEMGPALINWLETRRSGEKHRVSIGPSGIRRYLTLKEIAQKWRADRTRFGVTDMHIRGSKMENVAAPDLLSSFNLLPHSSVLAREQEMFSFVISSRGQVTDFSFRCPRQQQFLPLWKKAVAGLGYLRRNAAWNSMTWNEPSFKGKQPSTWTNGFLCAAPAGSSSTLARLCSCQHI